jgi:hypothetical protein
MLPSRKFAGSHQVNNVAKLSTKERAELFAETGARKGMVPAVVEKDFWACWALSRLFNTESISKKILFKGGTSLSKVFNLIKRFSEDIDLILSWDEITQEDPLGERSRKQQRIFNEELRQKGHQYIHDKLFPEIDKALGDFCKVAIQDDSPAVIDVHYPESYSESYLRPAIRLEIGPRALWYPNARHNITPYAAEEFPHLFETPQCQVNVVVAERTFWEKATILHHEAHRPEENTQPLRYSRHYYDMARMATSPIKDAALQKLDLLGSVVAFKDKFYPRGWARYDLAVPGTFKLLPPEYLISDLRKDYDDMRVMIYGEIPDFSEIMEVLSALEDEINQPTF